MTSPVRRDLLGKLAALDSAFANITAALEANDNMLGNSIIVYTADKRRARSRTRSCLVPRRRSQIDMLSVRPPGSQRWPHRADHRSA